MSAVELHQIYTLLHQRAINALVDCRKIRLDFAPEPNGLEGSSSMSYNMAMTDKALVICPRRTSGMVLQTGNESSQFTTMVELNGTLLGGTLLVKNEAHWNTLKKDKSQLSQILEDVGIPSSMFTNMTL
jgi:ATP adenylyltransferase